MENITVEHISPFLDDSISPWGLIVEMLRFLMTIVCYKIPDYDNYRTYFVVSVWPAIFFALVSYSKEYGLDSVSNETAKNFFSFMTVRTLLYIFLFMLLQAAMFYISIRIDYYFLYWR